MKCSLGISNFCEEISSLSQSIVFLYFFALIIEEDFLISPCYSLELCIQMGSICIQYLSCSLLFASLLFTAICKASPDSHFAFLHLFAMGMVLIPVFCTILQTSRHPSIGLTLFSKKHPLLSFRGGDRFNKVPVVMFYMQTIAFSLFKSDFTV